MQAVIQRDGKISNGGRHMASHSIEHQQRVQKSASEKTAAKKSPLGWYMELSVRNLDDDEKEVCGGAFPARFGENL